MKKKVYVSSSLDNHEEVTRVQDLFARHGMEVTLDWAKVHRETTSLTDSQAMDLASKMKRAVSDADVVLVLLPGGRGTHVELGLAIASRRPVVLYKPESMKDSVFYHDWSVCLYEDKQRAIDFVIEKWGAPV